MISLFAHLTRLEIPFLLIGGRGLEAHGYVRNTHDLDLLVRLTDLSELARSIREFWNSPEKVDTARLVRLILV